MKRRTIALLVWGALLAAVLIFAGMSGRNCELPKSGIFHWLLQDRSRWKDSVEMHRSSFQAKPDCGPVPVEDRTRASKPAASR